MKGAPLSLREMLPGLIGQRTGRLAGAERRLEAVPVSVLCRYFLEDLGCVMVGDRTAREVHFLHKYVWLGILSRRTMSCYKDSTQASVTRTRMHTRMHARVRACALQGHPSHLRPRNLALGSW